MIVVRSYEMPFRLGVHEIAMPQGAEILHFAMRGDTPTVWARVDIHAPLGTVRVALVLDSEAAPPAPSRHIGTAQTHDGWGNPRVLHAFRE